MSSAEASSSSGPRYWRGSAAEEATLHEPRAARRPVPEALLHDLWRRQQFDHDGLGTVEGEPLSISHPGLLNTDGGPDFRGARLRIAGQQWHGDVEIHPASGGWFDHAHHRDARYNAVVLHVALYADAWTGDLVRADGSPLPEVLLAPRLTTPLRELLHDFRTREEETLLCAPRWDDVPDALRGDWIATMTRERLASKTKQMADRYLSAPSLEALLQERLFAALGYAKNDAPMSDLARRLPLAYSRRFTDRRDLEALFLGTAGLLPAPADLLAADRTTADYATDLARRYQRLRRTADLPPPLERTSWRFFRLRPANFPPLRIAQAVALVAPDGLLHQDPMGQLLEAVRAEEPVLALRSALDAVPSAFWQTHFRLEKSTKPRDPSIGRRRRDTMIVNAVVPVLSLYAEQHEDHVLEEALHGLLRQVPAGSDRITRRFAKLGLRPRHAAEEQGLHHLYRTRCSQARCLSCAIGQHLLEP